MMDDYGQEYVREGRRPEREQVKRFTDSVQECMKNIEDIIMVDANQNLVDIDILIDILSDSQATEDESLELYAVKAIKLAGKKEICIKDLAQSMKEVIERLPLKDNLKKWWTSFKSVEKGGGEKYFQVKKIKEYTQNMEGMQRISRDQEHLFKDRDIWTYKQLSSACCESK